MTDYVANEWTRADLPDVTELCRMSVYNIDVMVDRNLNAIVDHLNANHQKPGPDRWRRAHSIVEQERDTARERLREVETALAKCMSDYQDVEDERDAAEYAVTEMERERDKWKARAAALGQGS